MALHRRLTVTDKGDVTIVGFVDRKILDESSIQDLGIELFSLIESEGVRRLVLNFTRVDFLSSAALGKLTTLDRKVKAAKGKLKLCCIRPEIYEVFKITRLDRLFEIHPDEESAVAAIE